MRQAHIRGKMFMLISGQEDYYLTIAEQALIAFMEHKKKRPCFKGYTKSVEPRF